MQSERNRQSFNQQAAGNGLNTGTASQAALAQNSAWQRDYGKLRTAQADAMATAQRGINDLTAQYQSNVAAATANNDYQRWAALLDEYNNQYQRNMQQAQTLAGYGDFSGYASLYGQETADNMSRLWTAQNPGLAYNMGRITAEEYRRMTGSYPPGYTPPQTARTYYYPPSPNSDDDDNEGKENNIKMPVTATEMGNIVHNLENATSAEQFAMYANQAQQYAVDRMTTQQYAVYEKVLASNANRFKR